MKKYLFLLFFLFPISFLTQAEEFIFDLPESDEVPVLFKGRIRSMNAFANLWLFELHNRGKIPSPKKSSLEMIWKMHFLGHSPWDNTTLFRIENNHVKKILGINVKQDDFPYPYLKNILFDNPEFYQNLLKYLLTHHLAKIYASAPFSKGNFSLNELSKNLKISFQENEISVKSLPQQGIWKYLKESPPIKIDADLSLLSKKNKKREIIAKNLLSLLEAIEQYENLTGSYLPYENGFIKAYKQLRDSNASSEKIFSFLDSHYDVNDRLNLSGGILKTLPNKKTNDWHSLHATKVKVYDKKNNCLKLVENFTPYPDEEYLKIRDLHSHLEKAFIKIYTQNNHPNIHPKDFFPLDPEIESITKTLFKTLSENYQRYVNKNREDSPSLKAASFVYPSKRQLQAENFYYKIPLNTLSISFYTLSLFLFFFAYALKKNTLHRLAIASIIIAFQMHSALLGLRFYILERLPIYNFLEISLCIPWIATLFSFILLFFLRSKLVLVASSILSILLLSILSTSQINNALENAETILNSQNWLTLQFLSMMGSFGILVLCGILGHIYLAWYSLKKGHIKEMNFIISLIFQTMRFGIILILLGTFLEGVWALGNWEETWIWNPQKFWIFLSISPYLFFIYLYVYKEATPFSLALESVVGILILGAHYIFIYEWNNGNEKFYGLFLSGELAFIALSLVAKRKIAQLKSSL